MHRSKGEIIAWRGWRFDDEVPWEPVLRSITFKSRWEGPALTADKPPTAKGEHGIYSLKHRPRSGGHDSSYFAKAVFGEVALSGVVVEAERGYRAETAVIRSLWMANPKEFGPVGDQFCPLEIAGLLEKRYEVDVQFANEDWDEWRDHNVIPYNTGGILTGWTTSP
jgi:hypothetical protein